MMGMPCCRDVAEAIASDRLEVSPPRRRLAIWLHLALCRHCRRYARQMLAIGAAARQLFGAAVADDQRLTSLREAIVERGRR
jgi:hypothetical protein